MKLREFSNERESVVLFLTGVGCASVAYFRIGDPDYESAEDRGLFDMDGEVDSDGVWHWNGRGQPTYYGLTSLLTISALFDPVLLSKIGFDD